MCCLDLPKILEFLKVVNLISAEMQGELIVPEIGRVWIKSLCD